jgi:hypothetical protein
MLETMSELALQRDAYRAGDEIKRAHTRACCVMQGAEVMALSSDYACLQLFKEQQQSWMIANLHQRAGLRMWAFCQGYAGETLGCPGGRAQAASPMYAKKRRGMHRHTRSGRTRTGSPTPWIHSSIPRVEREMLLPGLGNPSSLSERMRQRSRQSL